MAGATAPATTARSPIIAVERLYPLPQRTIGALARGVFDSVDEVRWVQDEPEQPGGMAVHGPQPAAARSPRSSRPGRGS